MFENDLVVVIPAYHPEEKIISICEQLQQFPYKEIVVVSDGNEADQYNKIFKRLVELNVTVLRHAVNQGKGRALKTAFNYLDLKYVDKNYGVVTIDADGQHTLDSILACCKKLDECLSENVWVFGCRNFNECINENGDVGKVPFRSRFGNEITKRVLKWICGINLSDTQTGLRGFPAKYLGELLVIDGEKYEYEMNQILYSKDQEISLTEVPIQTVYEGENATSHFNPILDSWKIYKPILKYTGSSVLSLLVEYIVFGLGIAVGGTIAISNYFARFCSAGINFYTNKKLVFKNNGRYVPQLVQYVLLCLLSITISTICINFINKYWGYNVVLIKAVVDTLLYFANFVVQSRFIFKRR